jgi:TolB protein
MTPAPPVAPSPRFSRLDRAVAVVAVAAVMAIGLLLWRGDRVGLGVAGLTPAADAASVSTRTGIEVRFADPLAGDESAVRLRVEPPVTGTVQIVGDRLLFSPQAPLQPNTLYTVRLEPGLASAQGRRLLEPLEWRFATGQWQVAYTAFAAGADQLFAVPAPLAPPAALPASRQLSRTSSGIWDFAPAPDGGRVAYSAPNAAGGSDLYLAAPGAEPEVLAACDTAFCSGPAWAPDGSLLVYSQRNASEFAASAVNPPRLYVMNVRTSETAPVFADSQKLGFDARWSFDGQWLSFLSPDLVGLGAYNVQTGDERLYATATGEPGVWRPGRTEFLMTREGQIGDQFVTHLVAVDPVAGTERDLSGAEALVGDGAPAWSPDGEWIALRRNELAGPNRSLSKQIWLMRADGTEARPLTTELGFDHGAPAWSPDGRYLLYHRFPLKGPDIVISTWILDVATGEQWEVARPAQRPQWLP